MATLKHAKLVVVTFHFHKDGVLNGDALCAKCFGSCTLFLQHVVVLIVFSPLCFLHMLRYLIDYLSCHIVTHSLFMSYCFELAV